jgi:hypothetical protein
MERVNRIFEARYTSDIEARANRCGRVFLTLEDTVTLLKASNKDGAHSVRSSQMDGFSYSLT